jgi:Ca2+-binding RTX toxin-like protein
MSGSNDAITVSGGSLNCVVGGSGQYSDATATVDINAGFATISALGMSEATVNFSGSGNRLDFINQSILPQTVLGQSFGSITVSGGTGGGIYQGGLLGANFMVGGSGADTFIGGGSGDLLTVNSGTGQNMLISGKRKHCFEHFRD